MDDLVAFVEARLAEDEAAAEGVTAGPWRYNPDKMWNLPGQHFGEEFIAAGPLDRPICVAATGDADDPQSMTDAAFIARHDPARVLREVEAKRRLLKEYREAQAYYTANRSAPAGEVQGLWTAVQLLAAPFADHADFRTDWDTEERSDG